jgi:hypothetical protein
MEQLICDFCNTRIESDSDRQTVVISIDRVTDYQKGLEELSIKFDCHTKCLPGTVSRMVEECIKTELSAQQKSFVSGLKLLS